MCVAITRYLKVDTCVCVCIEGGCVYTKRDAITI